MGSIPSITQAIYCILYRRLHTYIHIYMYIQGLVHMTQSGDSNRALSDNGVSKYVFWVLFCSNADMAGSE